MCYISYVRVRVHARAHTHTHTVFAQFVSSQMGIHGQLQEMAAEYATLKVGHTYNHCLRVTMVM